MEDCNRDGLVTQAKNLIEKYKIETRSIKKIKGARSLDKIMFFCFASLPLFSNDSKFWYI